jgi:hypothetical protein
LYQLVGSRHPHWFWDDLYLERHGQSCPRQNQACQAMVIVRTRDSLPGLAKEAQNVANVWMEEVVSTVFAQDW